MTATELLAGKRAVVTGGANGLGAAIVRGFAAAGAVGVVLDLPQAVGGDLPEGWSAVGVDLRDDATLQAAFEQTGDIDVVVAAAGIVPAWTATETLALAVWDDVFRVNARGVIATIQHSVPRMPGAGSIIVMASLNAWRGDPRIASYVASKHAALGIVRSTALELGARGIRVNALAPGPIATEALLARMERRERELGIPVEAALEDAARATALGRIATADEVAAAALFLASEMSSGITGQMLPVDGGIA